MSILIEGYSLANGFIIVFGPKGKNSVIQASKTGFILGINVYIVKVNPDSVIKEATLSRAEY